MSIRSWLAAAAVWATGAAAAQAAKRSGGEPSWEGLATSHFILYTHEPGEAARRALARLEQQRIFFERVGLAKAGAKSCVQIVAFDSEKEYDSYRINPGAFAFYQRARDADFIVMRDLDREHYEVALHEYTHSVVAHSGLKLPLWLNEGLADLYSSVEARERQMWIGGAPMGRLNSLDGQQLLPLDLLTSVDNNSAYYRQPDKMLVFYAQSWALTHMLALEPRYAPEFRNFLSTISSGLGARESLQKIYHKTLEQVASDLDGYVNGKGLRARAMGVDATSAPEEVRQVEGAQGAAEWALAEVLASNPPTAAEGKRQLECVARKHPNDAAAEESLGFLALRQNSQQEARDHFERAESLFSKNPDVLFHLAHLRLAANEPADRVIDLLERVLAIDPEHYNARLELGFAAAKAKRFEMAATALASVKDVQPEHAYAVSYTLAYCYLQLNQDGPARQYGERARQSAQNNSDREQVVGLLRYIDEESHLEVASR